LSQRLVLTGRVITPGTAQLGVVTLGTVATVHVDAGAHVAQGQPLLHLSDAEARAAVAQARAGLHLASAQLGQVRKISGQVADANVGESRVALEQARRELMRVELLATSGAVTVQALDTARDSVAAAESRLASAEARAAGARGPESQVAGARIAEARAALELAEVRMAQTQLLAPSAGTITERRVEPGDIVQPGKVLLVLARDGELRLEAQADEKNLGSLKPGLVARVIADGLPERPFLARLDWVSPAVDAERGTVSIKLTLEQAIPELKPDMTVSINLELSRRDNALLVPFEAVRGEASDHPWVAVLQGARAQRAPVVVGVRGSQALELVSGVDEHATIITTAGIVDGARVRSCKGD
jgi:HlyD family secretion protein